MKVNIQLIDELKGKGIVALENFRKGSLIFEEDPIVACQFSWNAACKYEACNHCLKPLETAEENVRRLTGNTNLVLPYPECSTISKSGIVQCVSCGTKYCSQQCQVESLNQYHKVLCFNTLERNNGHPLEQLEETWKQVHYPPETSSIFLIVRLLARVIQAPNKEEFISQILNFCHRSKNEEKNLAHKLLGEKYAGEINLLRELLGNAIPNENIQEFLSPEGFQSLLALLGTNGQGVGTSPFSAWRENVHKKNLSSEELQKVDDFIDKIYEDMYSHTGDFLNSEGVALYVLQSCANHSCMPNAEIRFLHNNSRLSLVALEDIEPNEEICISYLDECALERSRHSRRKLLQENYLFACECPKCISQIDDPDITSDEEMSECDSE
ncbi:SET and MYND domain-containing protein 5 [Sitophilus oryzae]|uniref:Protein-lysine N-trimethyltransferase SMYD5 n=1 Tax=Sitophilus oryzae TaxID=7048 RepID=A0A6J2YWC0_SITOR|nr:SET and MYND domain-containing protein 5 [Sitophilus oryzae]XP_030767485.1 SET and MYND domain-containing protein 5 [Sitophilus oryzae]XP_030767486.1 SET and MYND domain-containing protein 5 [Sitophilus oryzae]